MLGPIPGAPGGEHRFPKALHVSPFMGMDQEYVLRCDAPGDRPGEPLVVRLASVESGEKVFEATLALRRREATRRELGRLLWSYPLMTLQRLGRDPAPGPGPVAQGRAVPSAPVPLRLGRSGPGDFGEHAMSEASTTGARAAVRKLAGLIRHGTLVVREGPNEWRAGSGEPVAHATVHDPRVYAALLAHGARGFGRSYVDGWWDADDPTALVRLLLRNLEGVTRVTDRVGRLVSTLADPLDRRRHRRVDPTVQRRTDRQHIRAHYDLGNEYFELMLDDTMTYSCALFDHAGATLAEASQAKLDRICTELHLGPTDHVVEIGTGWGSFALHAASRYGCHVTTTTISDAQFEYASKRVVDAGLDDLVDVRNDDYRDLTGTFDKLVSIEMIEAVGWRQFDTFFATCNRLLSPDGLMMLQAIVIDDRSYERSKRRTDFIKGSVFPGGCLPSVAAIVASTARVTDLSVIGMHDLGVHYPETLRRWRANLIRHADEIESPETGTALIDPAGLRLFHLYLCYCEAAFLERHVTDVQLVFAGRRWRP